MGAPKGNKYWQLREFDGQPKIFKNPIELWDSAMEYFDWCDNNPWLKNEAVKAGDHFGEHVSAPTQRPYTIRGLCVHIGITRDGLKNYGSNKESYKDYFVVYNKIMDIIETNQVEGSMVGAYNANITARLLGLVEKKETEHKGAQLVILPKNKKEQELLNDLAE